MTARLDSRFTSICLGIGIFVPVFYFGIQFVAAAFYPNYSFMSRDASTLGSADSHYPAIFNIGAIFVGIMTLIATWGYLRALKLQGTNPFLTWFTGLSIVSFGLTCINAGSFPLPDPRHTDSFLAIIGIGMIFLPFLIPAALRVTKLTRPMKIYFASNIIVLIALFPILSGLIQVILVKYGTESPTYQTFLNENHGLLQRIFALCTIGPIGVGAYVLLNHRLADKKNV